MQTAAFLQLILTLAAIASRLSSLLSEVHSCVELAQTACFQLLQTLDVGSFSKRTMNAAHADRQPKLAQTSRHLVEVGRPAKEIPTVDIPTPEIQDTLDQAALDNADEDIGAVLVRRPATAIEGASAAPPQAGTPAEVIPSLREELNLTAAVNGGDLVSAVQPDADRIRPADSIIQTAVKRKNETEVQPKKAKKKVKKKRDEIDDIFGS